MDLVLASASPRRKDLLGHLGIPFRVVVADIDETPFAGELPVPYTLRLAEAKARAVFAIHPRAVVLGADTTVIVDDLLLGKPADAADAARMLRLLSGRSHQVTTGVAVVSTQGTVTHAETTTVWMDVLSDEEIECYVAGGEPMDKAGAYAIQGDAMRWISRIEGDYSNVVGLPVARVHALLRPFRT